MIEVANACKFPSCFLNHIHKLNSKKNTDAPSALILCAARDDNGFLATAPTHAQILQIAKTHKVAIMSINNANQLGQKIKSARVLLGRDISLLTIMAHGEADRMYFGQWSIFNFFFKQKIVCEENDLHPEDFSCLSPEAKIALYSCKTGCSIAQKVADVAKRTVFAPTGKIYDASTCFVPSKRHGIKMLSYNEDGEQHIRVFKPNLSSELMTPRTIDSKENRKPFSLMASYLKMRAKSGETDAQCKLGIFYEQGKGGLEQSDREAARWFRLAATKGSGLAQFNLGCFYMTGRGGLEKSDVEAEKWMRRSAYHGIAKAQYYLGLFYLNGQGGLTQSDRKAAFLFFLAAAQLLPEAVYNLGVLYEHGRGVSQSNKEAIRLYEIAKNLGVREAIKRLKRLAYPVRFNECPAVPSFCF